MSKSHMLIHQNGEKHSQFEHITCKAWSLGSCGLVWGLQLRVIVAICAIIIPLKERLCNFVLVKFDRPFHEC